MHLREGGALSSHIRRKSPTGCCGNAFIEGCPQLARILRNPAVGVTAGYATCGVQGKWSESLRNPPTQRQFLISPAGIRREGGNVNRRQALSPSFPGRESDSGLSLAPPFLVQRARGKSDLSVRGATLTACLTRLSDLTDCLFACLLHLFQLQGRELEISTYIKQLHLFSSGPAHRLTHPPETSPSPSLSR